MWFLILAVLAFFAKFALRRPYAPPTGSIVGELRRSSAVADASLALRETDVQLVEAWQKLERMIQETPNPELTCLRIMTRTCKNELPRELVELWAQIDVLTDRCDRRATEYKTVAHRPAPTPESRAVGAAIMGRIRSQAAKAGSADIN
jgi:hypothetical protein